VHLQDPPQALPEQQEQEPQLGPMFTVVVVGDVDA